MKLVLDASIAVAAARASESSHASARDRVARALGGVDEIVVPVLFEIEVTAALARADESAASIRAYVDNLVSVAGRVAPLGPKSARMIREVAIRYRLRSADATYVWLAASEGIPLCTLDQEVHRRASDACD